MHAVGKTIANQPRGSSKHMVNPLFDDHRGIQTRNASLNFPNSMGTIPMDDISSIKGENFESLGKIAGL